MATNYKKIQISFLFLAFTIIFLKTENKYSKIVNLGDDASLEIFKNKKDTMKIKTKSGEISKSEIAILVVPGGGYEFCSQREGLPVAKRFLSLGYSSAVLKYSFSKGYPIHYNQGLKSIKLLSKYFKKIILIGFSAGAHLSGLLGTTEREKLFNAVGMILCYPVISFVKKPHKRSRNHFFGNNMKNNIKNRKLFSLENRVNSKTLPTFIWTVKCDKSVPYENTLYMVEKLKEFKVPYGYRIFNEGYHGMVFADKKITINGVKKYKYKEASKWLKLACNFMDNIIIKS